MSFCPSCGEVIQPTALVCYNCNGTLANKNNLKEDLKSLDEHSRTYNLGINLENFLEDTILRTGYINTEKRKKMIGVSGTYHEIDILAYNGTNIVAFECKNYNIPVGIKEIRDFKSKLDDLPHISEGVFVTNSRFTPEASNYANHYNIRLWDGENLSKIHYLSTIGRLNNDQYANRITKPNSIKYNADADDEVTVKNSLPVLIQYDTIKKIKIVNPQQATIAKSELIFFPFYVIKFSIKEEKKKWLGRKEQLVEDEVYIVNAIDGKILYETDLNQDINPFLFSKGNRKDVDPKIGEEITRHEENLIIQSIMNTTPRKNYKVRKNVQYDIVVHDSAYPIEAAERRIVEEIVDSKKVDYGSVNVLEYDEIYVPKWSLVIETLGLTYKRESIASTTFLFKDEIDLCSKDTEKEARKTYAVCEMCGAAVCSKHIINEESRFYCADHKISRIPSISKRIPRIEMNELMEIRDNVHSLLKTRVFNRKKSEREDNKTEEKTGIDNNSANATDIGNNDDSHQDKGDSSTVGRPIKW